MGSCYFCCSTRGGRRSGFERRDSPFNRFRPVQSRSQIQIYKTGTSIFFESFRSRFRQKAAEIRGASVALFFFFFFSFSSLDASRCVMPLRHIKPRGEDEKKKKATDRWRPGGWHSNVAPCLRRSTKDAGASEGNWKMTRRERERHGDESKGVDVGNQAVVEEARGMFEKTAIE